jgi:glutathione peroxidase
VREVPGLIALGTKYAPRGLALLFFPCNQFCSEEPGTASEISAFYVQQHGLPAPSLMERADVNGPNTQPVYRFLKAACGGDIEWNFTKFVIGRDGQVLQRFGQSVKPNQLEELLPAWLG